MPAPKGWYENFKKIIIGSEHLRGEDGGFYLRTPDDKFVFGPDDLFGGLKLMELNEAQIDKLYNAVQNEGVLLVNKNGDKNFKALYNNRAGEPKATLPYSTITDQDYSQIAKGALEKYSQIPANMVVREEQVKGLNETVKTVTDMYQGTSIDKLVKENWILDGKGNPIKEDPKNPWSTYEKIFNASNLEEGVLLQYVPSKDNPQEKAFNLVRKDKKFQKIQKDNVFIKPKVKEAAVKGLIEVYGELAAIKTKNKDLLKLKEGCLETIESLRSTNDLKKFKKTLNKFAKSADSYFKDKAPASLSKGKKLKLGIVNKIRNIRDAVKNEREALGQKDPISDMQARIAAKYVTAYCAKMENSKPKKSYTAAQLKAYEQKKANARAIMDDPEKFADAVFRTQNAAAFKYLYGDRGDGNQKDLFARVTAGLKAKPSEVYKSVREERKNSTPEKLQREAFLRQQSPTRVSQQKEYSPTPLQQQQQILDVINRTEAQLKAFGPSNSSPEYEKIMKNISVTKIRLERGNSFTNIKGDLAELGDNIDTYLDKKMKEDKLSSKSIGKMTALSGLKKNCDAVLEGKPAPKPLTQDEEYKDLLAERIRKKILFVKLQSKNPKVQVEAKKVLLDKNALEAEKRKLIESDAFKAMFGDEGKAKKALGNDIVDTVLSVGDKKAELLGRAKPSRLAQKTVEKKLETQAEKTVQKKTEDKVKVLGDKKHNEAPLIGGF